MLMVLIVLAEGCDLCRLRAVATGERRFTSGNLVLVKELQLNAYLGLNPELLKSH